MAAALFVSFSMIGPLAPLLAVSLGASPVVLGAVVSAAFALPLFLAIPAGSWVDAVGPRPALLVGLSILTLAPVTVAVAPSFPTLWTVQILSGLGQLVAVVAAQSWVARGAGSFTREQAFGWYGAAVAAGQLVGPLLGGVVLDAAGFSWAFGTASACAAMGIVAVAVTRDVPPSVRTGRPGSPAGAGGAVRAWGRWARRWQSATARVRQGASMLGEVARLPSAREGFVVSAALMVVISTQGAFLPAYLEGLQISATTIGAIVSARSLASIAVRPAMSWIVRVLGGRRPTFLLSLVASAVAVATFTFVGGLPVWLAGSLVMGLAVGVGHPLTMVAVIDGVDATRHGAVLGMRITVNRAAQVAGPLVLGAIGEQFGYPATFLAAAVCVVSMAWPVRAKAPSIQ